SRTGEIEQLLNWIPVRPGETYFTPAHTVHAIGAGIVLLEIQQNSDVTYRLWDYGRPRELHLEKAAPIADLGVHPGAVAGRVVCCRPFVTETVDPPPGEPLTPEARACHLWICVAGPGTIGAGRFTRGDVWLLPDSGEQPPIQATLPSRFLRTYVPE